MDWFVVLVLIAEVVGGASLAISRAPATRGRRAIHGLGVSIKGTGTTRSWGVDIDCGIDAVDRQGHVVGTMLVPAPSPN
jgi:hypothetical protein